MACEEKKDGVHYIALRRNAVISARLSVRNILAIQSKTVYILVSYNVQISQYLF